MFYYSKNSKKKVVHFEGCHHLNAIKAENLSSFESIKKVREAGYRMCSCCSPIVKKIRTENDAIQNFCYENGLLYFIDKGNLHIQTKHSKWKVLASDEQSKVELHHKNTYKQEYENSVPGYHKQAFCSESILGYMEYIVKHEAYRRHNPLPVKVEKAPPIKGTKRWNKQQKAIKRKERKQQIWNVLNLIDNLQVSSGCLA